MQLTDDRALLRAFAENQSDEAFATLVARYVNLVYSVALRHLGNPHHAEEITQAVFIILAKKAAQLRHDRALAHWLFQTTRLTANNFVRSEARRHRREQEAYMQSTVDESPPAVWPQIAPLLDGAVAGLREKERQAIVLRFYEGRNLREIGQALGTSEAAAEKQVSRALEKLRRSFALRGVALSGVAIAGAMALNSVQAAPVTLGPAVTAVAVTKGVTASASTLTLIKGALKIMLWTKIKTGIVPGIGLLIAAGATKLAVGIIEQRSMDAHLSDWELTNFKTAPPLVFVHPTHFPQPKHLTQNGKAYLNANQDRETGKMVGRHVWLKYVIETAYNFPENRIIFPADNKTVVMLTNYYDFLVTTGNHPREQLQVEIKRQLSLAGRREMIGTNEMLVVEQVK